jgi:hypothetical protein
MKLNSVYEALTYGYRNMDNGKLYPGFHKTKEENDGYVFSSLDEELKSAHQFGRLEKVILWRGTVSECITLEHYILKSYSAITNENFYNKSVGGGIGLVKDFSNLTDTMKNIANDWVSGTDPVWETAQHDVDIEDVKKIKTQIETGFYVKILQDVGTILALPKNQVREEVYDPKHVEDIKNEMLNNTAKAREVVQPIIVVVFQDGRMEIIDGNHTIRAAHEAGWTKIKVVYINSTDFNNKQCNIDWFGYYMNHKELKKKGNTDGDCKKAVARYALSHPQFPIGTEDFKQSFMKAYDLFWNRIKIAKCIESVMRDQATQQAMADHNFKLYSDKELKDIVTKEENKDSELAVVSISASSCYNSGLGAILNKMGEMSDKLDKRCEKGLIIISCRSFEDYKNKNAYQNKLNRNLKLYGAANIQIKTKWLKEFVKTK